MRYAGGNGVLNQCACSGQTMRTLAYGNIDLAAISTCCCAPGPCAAYCYKRRLHGDVALLTALVLLQSSVQFLHSSAGPSAPAARACGRHLEDAASTDAQMAATFGALMLLMSVQAFRSPACKCLACSIRQVLLHFSAGSMPQPCCLDRHTQLVCGSTLYYIVACER